MDCSRRDLLLASASLALAPAWSRTAESKALPLALGGWETSPRNLPIYRYDGVLPVKAADRAGHDAQLPPDPAFILGNYRITAFAHASGVLQILTGERAWARVNADPQRLNYGVNAARLVVGQGKAELAHDLVGLNSLAADPAKVQRRFGPGFARWDYNLSPTLTCRRTVSVKPSAQINTGNPSLVVSVEIINSGRQPVRWRYEESLGTDYVLANQQRVEPQARSAHYPSSTLLDNGAGIALSQTRYEPNAFTVERSSNENNLDDVLPVNLFVQARGGASLALDVSGSTDAQLRASVSGQLAAGASARFVVVVGLTYGGVAQAAAQADDLLQGIDLRSVEEGLFASAWADRLPDLSRETNAIFKIEMPWNAYVLEAMATYSEYFKETFVPQGTIYAYEDGENISNRDNLQALLPLCTTNPQLARSCLAFVIKQTTDIGEIKRGTGGHGYVSPGVFKESDAQIYMFMAVGEYLRATKDYEFLDQRIEYYPMEAGRTDTVLNMLRKHFVYLRDEVGLGPHGLVRILNSDWSDSFFHKYSPNTTQSSAESHLNSAMALAVIPTLREALEASGRKDVAPFAAALDDYLSRLRRAYFADLGERSFSARAYLNGGRPSYGLDIVCLEPQGFLLQNRDLSPARKAKIYDVVKAKTFTPEKVGFRIREKPIFGGDGGGEDGGLWFALEGQMVLGVISFDKAEAERLLEVLSFHNFAQQYPAYSLGRWTASDSIQSNLHEREGLMNYWKPSLRESGIGYCSHPHSWPLYNYCRLRAD